MPTKNRQLSRLLRWAQILILEMLNVLLRSKFEPALYSEKLSDFWSSIIKIRNDA